MKILITGFDPFGKETVNPSSEALALLRGPEGSELIKVPCIPTVYGAGQLVIAEIEKFQPQTVVCLGQAGGRNGVTPERVAINIRDCSMADNQGWICLDEPVVPGGKNAYFSTLPVKDMAAAIQHAGLPAQVSNTAGTFVCNSVLYEVLQYCEAQAPHIRAGFIHVPFLPCQTESRPNFPSMSLTQMAEALEAALSVL